MAALLDDGTADTVRESLGRLRGPVRLVPFSQWHACAACVRVEAVDGADRFDAAVEGGVP